MASVVFIRIPYEKESDSKTEEVKENRPRGSNEKNDVGASADPNVKEVKFENDKTPDLNEAAIHEPDETIDDVEMFTGSLNLAEVFNQMSLYRVSQKKATF